MVKHHDTQKERVPTILNCLLLVINYVFIPHKLFNVPLKKTLNELSSLIYFPFFFLCSTYTYLVWSYISYLYLVLICFFYIFYLYLILFCLLNPKPFYIFYVFSYYFFSVILYLFLFFVFIFIVDVFIFYILFIYFMFSLLIFKH